MGEEEPTQGLPRKERERLAHRREIIGAAERVFARNGHRGSTVEQIAQEAEFAVGTLYNFFKSKEELYEEVLASLVEQAVAAGVAPRGKFTTIHSGMDVGPFLAARELREEMRARLGYAPGDFVIAKLARLFDLKGHEYVIAAAPLPMRMAASSSVLRGPYLSESQPMGMAQVL